MIAYKIFWENISRGKSVSSVFYLLAAIIIAALLLTACPEPEPDYDIFLSAEEIFCTWVTLKVTVPDSGNINRFMIKRDGKEIINTTLVDDDTLILNSFLKSDTDYAYRAYFVKDSTVKDSSDELTVHTLPKTSHDFTWEIDTLGTGSGNSSIRDVFIISEDDVWSVGYINNGDSTYNAAHWNGNEWKLILISPMGLINPISSIFAIYENDIWFKKVGLPVRWDGNSYFKYTPSNSTYPGQPSIDAIWGSSSSDVYFVGREGSIVHYNGSTFREMESGTDIDLTDIWGVVDPETGEPHVWACGNASDSRASVILYLKDGQWNKI